MLGKWILEAQTGPKSVPKLDPERGSGAPNSEPEAVPNGARKGNPSGRPTVSRNEATFEVVGIQIGGANMSESNPKMESKMGCLFVSMFYNY